MFEARIEINLSLLKKIDKTKKYDYIFLKFMLYKIKSKIYKDKLFYIYKV